MFCLLLLCTNKTILAFTKDNAVWQSNNEGFTWQRLFPDETIVALTMHPYSEDRAYLITNSRTVYYTQDRGTTWGKFQVPIEANVLGIPLLDFHPTRSDWLIWTGSEDCSSTLSTSCRAKAYWTTDNGRNWHLIDSYVRTCTWGRDKRLKIDERLIYCESYKTKEGSQRSFEFNALEFWMGTNFYGSRTKLFDSVAGFATFEEYMVVAEVWCYYLIVSLFFHHGVFICVVETFSAQEFRLFRLDGVARR
jgi:hypothetical protein